MLCEVLNVGQSFLCWVQNEHPRWETDYDTGEKQSRIPSQFAIKIIHNHSIRDLSGSIVKPSWQVSPLYGPEPRSDISLSDYFNKAEFFKQPSVTV